MSNLVEKMKNVKEATYTSDVEFTPAYVEGVAVAVKQIVTEERKKEFHSKLMEEFLNNKEKFNAEVIRQEKGNEVSYSAKSRVK